METIARTFARLRRLALPFAFSCAAVLPAGCLEIEGQRIVIRYDSEQDELRLLLLYDGVHDDGERWWGNGEKQVREAVANGDWLLLRWPLHYSPQAIASGPDDADTPEAVRVLAATMAKRVRTHVLGHYRDEAGHVGAAQLVVVRGAREVLQQANAAINAGLLWARDHVADEPGEPFPWPAMRRLWYAKAAEAWQWLSLRGNSLQLLCPVDPGEWSRAKALALDELRGDAMLGRVVRGIAGGSFEIDDRSHEGFAVLRLGEPAVPSTFRFRLHDDYRPNLEAVVAETIPARFEAVLAARLLEAAGTDVGDAPEGGPPADVARMALQMAPPEDKVRALLHANEHGAGDEVRTQARALLQRLGPEWAEASGFAPSAAEGQVTATQWRAFCARAARHGAPPLRADDAAAREQNDRAKASSRR